MISKKASAIKLEELAAPLTYIPNAKPKSQSILTGIVRIVTIIEIVMSSRVLCEHKKNVYPIKKKPNNITLKFGLTKIRKIYNHHKIRILVQPSLQRF